ncbi:hypothetical protein [Bartonella taylorii]|uniref:hypothetical protein n=1 Tax=Bartonella taylorii TaxID=33046 RepID=UPI001ABA83A8|nr:hypothetical protein [Bartonella taylorii]
MTKIPSFFPVRESAKIFRISVLISWQRIADQMMHKSLTRGALSCWEKFVTSLLLEQAKRRVISATHKETLLWTGQDFFSTANLYKSKTRSVVQHLKDIMNGL